MALVHKLPRARHDLKRLWRYIAEEASPSQAETFLKRLDGALSDLAAMPYNAPAQPQLGPEIRRFVFRRRYLVFYRPTSDGIEVIRVLHGARDIRPEMFS